MTVNRETKIKASMDIQYDDGSFSYDHSIDFRQFVPVLSEDRAERAVEYIGQPTSKWQRQCIIVDAIRPIRYVLLTIMSDNKPTLITNPNIREDIFVKPNASFSVWTDISIQVLRSISQQDAKYRL